MHLPMGLLTLRKTPTRILQKHHDGVIAVTVAWTFALCGADSVTAAFPSPHTRPLNLLSLSAGFKQLI